MSLISDALKEAQKRRDELNSSENEIFKIHKKSPGKKFLITGIISVFILIGFLLFLFLFTNKQKGKTSFKTKKYPKKIALLTSNKKENTIIPVTKSKKTSEKEEKKTTNTLSKRKTNNNKTKQKTLKTISEPKQNITIIKNKTKIEQINKTRKKKKTVKTLKKQKKSEDIKETKQINKKPAQNKSKTEEQNGKEIKKVVKISPESMKDTPSKEYYFRKAMEATKIRDYEQAIKNYYSALSYSPEDITILYNLGTIYLLQKKYLLALNKFEEILKIKPTDKRTLFNAGISLFKIGKIEKSKILWKNLYSLDPNYKDINYFLGIAEDYTQNYKNAKKHYYYYLSHGNNPKFKRWILIRLKQLGKK